MVVVVVVVDEAGGAAVPFCLVAPAGAGGGGGTTGWASTATSTCTARPSTVRSAASTRQPPACEVKPDFTPTMPPVPTPAITFCMVPAMGKGADGMATIWAKVGMRMSAAAILRQSAAVETEPGSNPLASTKWVDVAPRAAAVAFILATKAGWVPASHSARA